VLGMMALPAMTTVSFFLGRIIASAESGRPFSVPGSVQKIRFPSYTWVLTGVVFALLTGYTPIWTNYAFLLWTFAGSMRVFDMAYLGALAWAAATGFTAPISFLVLAFAPERAATWAENLLAYLLPAGKPAPSTQAAPVELTEAKPERWPQFHYWLKTGLAIGAIAGLGGLLSVTVFGPQSFLIHLAVAAGITALPLVFSKYVIKTVMKATPMSEDKNPEIYGIVRELRDSINQERAKHGKKPIPMPEMLDVPMGVPNAFASGPSPMMALVGVTDEMKDMTLNPARTREGLIRLLDATEQHTKSFKVFRKAIRGSIPGLREDAKLDEVREAVRDASDAQIRALGIRTLRGVLGHEFSHVMHRDMVLGAIVGTLASAIAFSAYGILWGLKEGKGILKPLLGRPREKRRSAQLSMGGKEQGLKPEMFDPVSTGVAVAGLAKIFVALWVPIVATLIQMASSRTREGHADEAGGLLVEDPESLALGLGLLTSWRPQPKAEFEKERLPLIAAQAHMMTVNPLEQLKNAGILPGMDALSKLLVSKEDDFFFNLFITHPDTTQRIERLHDMAEALSAAR
jgi:Zn-dependent protease with chaperone function